MSDSISDDDDDLNQLLSYDPFSTERPAAKNSDDNCIVEEALDEEEQKKDLGDASIDGIAYRKAAIVSLPNDITSPSELLWYIQRKKNSGSKRSKRSIGTSDSTLLHIPASSNESYFPCRKCDPAEAIGLNIKETFDTDKKTLVQFIEPGMKMGDRQVVSNKHLFPYHNCASSCPDGSYANGSEMDATTSLSWCHVLCNQYEKQCQNNQSLTAIAARAEVKYLQRVLQHAIEQQKRRVEQREERLQEHLSLEEEEEKERAEFTPADKALSNDEELEVPYTQDWGGDNDFDGLYPFSSSTPKEPLRPGDVISYRSHLFVAGDKRGERVATVIEVRPKEDPILRLDNNEYLLPTTQVKRIRVKKGGDLEEHPQGLYREIQDFKLKMAGPLPGYNQSTEAQRFGKIMQRFNTEYIQVAQDQGMPIDMMNRYKGIEVVRENADSSAGSNLRRESKKASDASKNVETDRSREPLLRKTRESTRGKRKNNDKQNKIVTTSAKKRSKEIGLVVGDDDVVYSPPVERANGSESKGPRNSDAKCLPSIMVSSSQPSSSIDSDLVVSRKQKKTKKSSEKDRISSAAAASPKSTSGSRRKSTSDASEGRSSECKPFAAASPSSNTRSRRKSTSTPSEAKPLIIASGAAKALTITRRK